MRQSFSTSFFLFCTAALVVSESDNTYSLRRRQLGDEGAPQIPSKQPRIIGGDDADNDRYPYFALMNGRALCGAVLIGPRFVLTAAHCVGSDNDFQIGIAELSMWDSLVGSTKEYSYKQRLIHPDYDDNDILNDIAIYELNESLPSSIPYIKLKRDPLVASGTPLTVIGFGDTAASGVIENPSDSLLEATVDYVSQSSCRSQMGSSTITDDMLCAFGNGRDSCGGDSGGPLIMKGATPGSDELVGLVSWGVECAHPVYPGVYTRISYFYDWIVDSMCAMNPDGAPDGITCETGSVVDEVTAPPTSDTSTYSWGYADDDFYFYEQTDDDFFGGFWDEATAWFEDLFGF